MDENFKDHVELIIKKDAIKLTKAWRALPPPPAPSPFQGLAKIKAFNFTKHEINKIANQSGVDSIRFYFGYDNNSALPEIERFHLIFVGVDVHGNDIHLDTLGDFSNPCPTTCDKDGSPLNS